LRKRGRDSLIAKRKKPKEFFLTGIKEEHPSRTKGVHTNPGREEKKKKKKKSTDLKAN